MRHPSGQARAQRRAQLGPHVKEGGPRPSAKPFQAASYRKIHAPFFHVYGNRPRGLVHIENDIGAGFARASHDGLGIHDACGPKQDVAHRHQESPLIDGVEKTREVHADAVFRSYDADLRTFGFLGVAEIRHGREVHVRKDDLPPGTAKIETRKNDRFRDGHVRMKGDFPWICANNRSDQIAHTDRHLPPGIRPRLDSPA